MKKNTLTAITILSLLAAAPGCKTDFDTKPYDKIGEDVIWRSKANAETFIFSTYGIMNNFAGGPATDPRTTNTLGFDGIYGGASAVFNELTDRNTDMGFNNWAAIRRCNQIITKVAESAEISANDKTALIAEGKFLRAMSYFSVARSIGRIVWIDRLLTPEDDLRLPSTANPTETYAYIIKDLEDAIAGLPTTKVAGRANKYAAAALLSEVCLQALAYKNYPAAPAVAANDPLLDKAIANAQFVITEGGYAMESDYGGMFNEVKATSPEIIFGIYRKSINTTVDGTPMQLYTPNVNNDRISQYGGSPAFNSNTVFEAWVQHGPTQNIADDYLVVDQADPAKALPWDETSQFKMAMNEGVSIPTDKIPVAGGETAVQTGMIKPGSTETVWTLTNIGRDARWKASIISDSTDKHYGETFTTCIKGNTTRWMKINGMAYYVSLSNMYWRKGMYTNVSPRPYVGIPTDYHYVVTRLGRVYLNLAEAYLLKGDVANAVAALNKTREAHGKLPAAVATTPLAAWTDYKRERRVDLVLENDYYWSLLRWGRYGGNANHGIVAGGTIPELTEVPRVMDISKDRTAFSIVTGQFYSSNHIRNFDHTRRYLFPIAQSYIDQNPKFGPQNANW